MKTLAQARRLLGRHRMVTLEGELLEKTGAMTGGFQKRSVRGFAASVEDEVRNLLAAIAGQEAEAAGLEESVRRLTLESESLRAARSRADQEAARCGVLVEEYERRLQALAAEEADSFGQRPSTATRVRPQSASVPRSSRRLARSRTRSGRRTAAWRRSGRSASRRPRSRP